MMIILEVNKEKNYRKRHAKHPPDTHNIIPKAKRVKITPWQVFMKDFGDSAGIINNDIN